jgi:hypothetical protein
MTPSVLDLIRDARTVAELEAIRHEAQVHEVTMTAYLRRMAELTTSGHKAEPIQIATWKSTRAAQDDDHEPGKRNKTQGERLREAVNGADVDLFHDAEHRAYASFDVQDHQETWPVRSSGFRNYVRWLFYRANGKAPRAGDLADFVATIEGQAQFDGQKKDVHVRIAPTDDGIAIDLGDESWTAIEVDASGWRHVERPSARFVRPTGMLALPVPVVGGSIASLRRFLNVKDEDDWKLVIGCLLMMFRPTGPYPVLGLHGEQGAAKSTAMRVLRRLIDPRNTMDRSAPRDERDLAIHAKHNRVIALDNVSGLPDWFSDALARLATGSGFATRTLWENDQEFSFSAARPVMLNGIGEVITRSDLLDRAVLVSLEPIADEARRLEADFWLDFEAERPRILGAILEAVSCAIAREPMVKMDSWPRMADFARWVTAAEPALGWPDASFLAAYYANRGAAHEMAVDSDPVAIAVRDLMVGIDEPWEGRPTDLLEKLASVAGESVSKRKDWPSAANSLSNRLERLAPNLRALGITVERARKGTARTIRLSTRRVGPSRPSSSRSAKHDDEGTPDRLRPLSTVTVGGPIHARDDGHDDSDGLLPRPDDPPWPDDPPPAVELDDSGLGDLLTVVQGIFGDMLPEAQA